MKRRMARILFVTGKGGVGKTTVARLLATAATRRGMRSALVDVDGSASSEQPGGGAQPVVTTRIHCEEREALGRLLKRLLRLRFLSNRLMDSRSFSALTAAAPGVRDLLYLSQIIELAAGSSRGRHDLVVVDGPASGHAVALLEGAARVAQLVPIGPVGKVAREASAVVHDPRRFRAIPVTLAEDLCIRETLELLAELARHRIPSGPVVANAVYTGTLTKKQADWVRRHRASQDALLLLSRRRRQLGLIRRLESAGYSCVRLPHVPGQGAASARTATTLLDRLLRELS